MREDEGEFKSIFRFLSDKRERNLLAQQGRLLCDLKKPLIFCFICFLFGKQLKGYSSGNGGSRESQVCIDRLETQAGCFRPTDMPAEPVVCTPGTF